MHYKFYNSLPVLLQNLACNLYGLRESRRRFGKHFRALFDGLVQSDWYPREYIQRYKDEQLRKLVHHAYHTVPFYHDRMRQLGVHPGDISGVSDLKELPIVKKEDILDDPNRFLSSSYTSRRRYSLKTSGTTGTPLRVYTTTYAQAFQWAIWWRHRARFGVYPYPWHVNFTGKPVVPPSQQRPPFWRWSLPLRQATIGMQHILPTKVRAMHEFLEKHSFPIFVGYPSIVYALAKLFKDNDLHLSRPPSHVFLGAEDVQSYQRELIANLFHTVVTDQYGFTEGCGNASRCPAGSYHEDWEFCILEPVRQEAFVDGRTRGRILATGFANYAFPLIRYDVGDVALWEHPSVTCPCGRESTVIHGIEGRAEDVVLTPEGAQISRFDYVFKGCKGLKEAQVVQNTPRAITVRYVPRPGCTQLLPYDEDAIKSNVRTYISEGLDVRFDRVDMIPRAGSGKFRPVVSNISPTRQLPADDSKHRPRR